MMKNDGLLGIGTPTRYAAPQTFIPRHNILELLALEKPSIFLNKDGDAVAEGEAEGALHRLAAAPNHRVLPRDGEPVPGARHRRRQHHLS